MTTIALKKEPGKFPLLDLFDQAMAGQFSDDASEKYVGAEWAITGHGLADEDDPTAGLFFRSEGFNRMCVYAFLQLHADELMQQMMECTAENMKNYPEDYKNDD